jgi:hypothetical protein
MAYLYTDNDGVINTDIEVVTTEQGNIELRTDTVIITLGLLEAKQLIAQLGEGIDSVVKEVVDRNNHITGNSFKIR